MLENLMIHSLFRHFQPCNALQGNAPVSSVYSTMWVEVGNENGPYTVSMVPLLKGWQFNRFATVTGRLVNFCLPFFDSHTRTTQQNYPFTGRQISKRVTVGRCQPAVALNKHHSAWNLMTARSVLFFETFQSLSNAHYRCSMNCSSSVPKRVTVDKRHVSGL